MLTKNETLVLVGLKIFPKITSLDLIKKLGTISHPGFYSIISKLTKMGLVEQKVSATSPKKTRSGCKKIRTNKKR